MSTNGVLRYPNTCRILRPEKVSMPENPEGACGWRVDNLAFNVPILGQPPEDRSIKLIRAMGEHIAKVHPQHFAAILIGADQIMKAFLIADAFIVGDPNALLHVTQLRLQLLMTLHRPYIPDDHIREKIATLGHLTPDGVFQLMAQMRDILTETSPQQQRPLIVTP